MAHVRLVSFEGLGCSVRRFGRSRQVEKPVSLQHQTEHTLAL